VNRAALLHREPRATPGADAGLSLGFRPSQVWWPAVAVMAVLLVVGALGRQPADPTRSAIGTVLALVAVAALGAGGRRGALPLIGCAAVGLSLDAGANASDIAWFGLCVLVFGAVLTQGRRFGLICWLGAVLLLVSNWVLVRADLGWLPWMVGVSVCAGVAILIGRDRALLAELREAQAGLAERSRAEERNRIARDLHDVIAHSLTVSLLHISSARLAVEHDPPDAARALAEAERLGRESLDEVRSIVGLMRSPDGDSRAVGRLAPVPGLDTVTDLVERFRGAGADVTLECAGDLESVPATAGTTLYRIAQEALTNAAKHAPGSPVLLCIARLPGRVELTVENGGRPGTGRGMGLSTMRERAEAIGGSCEAGPGGAGWRVRASVPTPRWG
jgi:signal transduction histidine kinase